MKYESADDVRLRLQKSIVCHRGMPIMVDEVLSKNTVKVTRLKDREEYTVNVEDLDLSPSSIPLGFVQVDKNTVAMVSRKPVRKYKQGLTAENVVIIPVFSKIEREGRLNIPITSRQMLKTLHGEFPDIGDAFGKVRSGESRIQAFKKDWAIANDDGDLCLIHRGEIVGFATDTSIRLLPERAYLKEVLESCLK